MVMSTLQILTLFLVLKGTHGEEVNFHIVGGKTAGEEEFPFMAALTFLGGLFCGCTILNPSWVLTAAHCTIDPYPEHFEVWYRFVDQDSADMKRVQVTKIVNHQFDIFTGENDIALVKVEPEMVLSEHAKMVQLQQKGEETPEGTPAIALGWGKTNIGDPYSKVLQKVVMPITYEAECKEIYGARFHDSNICAGSDVNITGGNVCIGDSGGPLLVDNVQVGITSWGYLPCVEEIQFFYIFTKVSFYVDWIAQTLEDN